MTAHKKVFNVCDDNQRIIDEYLKFKTDQKPVERPRNLISPLRTLADYLGKKLLTNAADMDLRYFFNPKNKIVSLKSRNYMFTQIKLFYRWVDNLDRYTISPRLKWYEPITDKSRKRYLDPDRRKKHFISKEDYLKIINNSNDVYGQDKAIWETYYLSGIRPEEIDALTISSVKRHEDGNYEIKIGSGESKTVPRKIPLPERPDNLVRWLGNHPLKNNPAAPLFISYKSKNVSGITRDAIYRRFTKLKKENPKIKQSLTLESFRKNRATIMLNNKEYDNGKIAQFFGWTPTTVAQRRIDYELSNIDDLRKIVWSKPQELIDYDTIKKDKDKIERKYEPIINDLVKDNKKLKKKNKEITKILKINREEFGLKIEYLTRRIDYMECLDMVFYEELRKTIIEPLEEGVDLRKVDGKEFMHRLLQGKDLKQLEKSWVKIFGQGKADEYVKMAKEIMKK